MPSFLDFLRGATAQVNPFDGGADYNSVMRAEEERRKKKLAAQRIAEKNKKLAGNRGPVAPRPTLQVRPASNNSVQQTTRPQSATNIVQNTLGTAAAPKNLTLDRKSMDYAARAKQQEADYQEALEKRLAQSNTLERMLNSDNIEADARNAALRARAARVAEEAYRNGRLIDPAKAAEAQRFADTAYLRALQTGADTELELKNLTSGNTLHNVATAGSRLLGEGLGNELFGANQEGFQASDIGRFVANLPGGMASIATSAPSNISRAGTGKGVDRTTGEEVDLTTMQRVGSGLTTGVDAVGTLLGGSGTAIKAVLSSVGRKQLAQMGSSGIKQLLKKFGGDMGEEALEESAQYITELLSEEGNLDNFKFSEMASAAGQGAAGGGIFSGFGMAASFPTALEQRTHNELVQKNPKYAQLNDALNNSNDLHARAEASRAMKKIRRKATNSQGGFIAGPLAGDFSKAQEQGLVFEGVDGKPRFEVDDSGAKLDNKEFGWGLKMDGKPRKVGQILKHDKLFEQYPELKDIDVRYEPNDLPGHDAHFDPETNSIVLTKSRADKSQLSDIIHELQHSIQEKEGFARGGEPEYRNYKMENDSIKRGLQDVNTTLSGKNLTPEQTQRLRKRRDNLIKQLEQTQDQYGNVYTKQKAIDDYRRLAGEAEARAVQARMDMPMSERYVKPDDSFRDGHVAPSKDTTPAAQKMEDGGDFSLTEVAQGQHIQPSDYFDPSVGARYYGYDNLNGHQSATAIDNVRRALKAGKKDVTITAYRAVPNNVKASDLQNNDWVTFSENYAKQHGEHRFGEGEYKIIKQEVKPDDVHWDGNDINEWGYDNGAPNVRSTFYDSLDVPKQDLIIRNDSKKALSVEQIRNHPEILQLDETIESYDRQIKNLKDQGRADGYHTIVSLRRAKNLAIKEQSRIANELSKQGMMMSVDYTDTTVAPGKSKKRVNAIEGGKLEAGENLPSEFNDMVDMANNSDTFTEFEEKMVAHYKADADTLMDDALSYEPVQNPKAEDGNTTLLSEYFKDGQTFKKGYSTVKNPPFKDLKDFYEQIKDPSKRFNPNQTDIFSAPKPTIQEAPDPTAALKQEALKYKSAEEFVAKIENEKRALLDDIEKATHREVGDKLVKSGLTTERSAEVQAKILGKDHYVIRDKNAEPTGKIYTVGQNAPSLKRWAVAKKDLVRNEISKQEAQTIIDKYPTLKSLGIAEAQEPGGLTPVTIRSNYIDDLTTKYPSNTTEAVIRDDVIRKLRETYGDREIPNDLIESNVSYHMRKKDSKVYLPDLYTQAHTQPAPKVEAAQVGKTDTSPNKKPNNRTPESIRREFNDAAQEVEELRKQGKEIPDNLKDKVEKLDIERFSNPIPVKNYDAEADAKVVEESSKNWRSEMDAMNEKNWRADDKVAKKKLPDIVKRMEEIRKVDTSNMSKRALTKLQNDANSLRGELMRTMDDLYGTNKQVEFDGETYYVKGEIELGGDKYSYLDGDGEADRTFIKTSALETKSPTQKTTTPKKSSTEITSKERVQRALDPNEKLQYKNLTAKERVMYREAKKNTIEQPAKVADKPAELQRKTQESEISQNQEASQAKTDETTSVQKTSQKGTAQVAKLQESQVRKLDRSYIDNTTNVEKKRGFTQSVKASDEVSVDTKKKVSGKYNVRSTDKMAIEAHNFAQGNLKDVTTDVNERLAKKTGTVTDQDIADAIAVAKRQDSLGNYDTSQQIYDQLAEHGTRGGQAIQAFSLLQNRTPEGVKFQMLRNLKKAGVKLTEAQQKEVSALIDKVRKTKPNTEARNRALFDTLDYVNRKIPSNFGDKIVNFWRAGLLTAPKTTGGNIVGNVSELAARELWANPVAVATDKFFSMITGKRTKVLSNGGAIAKGAKAGVARGVDYMKTGFDTRNIGSKYDAPRRINYDNKVVDAYVNGVYRWMGAQDQPFYYGAKAAAAYDLAKADGMNLGYKGDQLAQYVEKSTSDSDWKPQTFETKQDATEYAKYAVYQNDTLLGRMAASVKNAADQKGLRWVTDFILPFTQVPSSIAVRVVDRTPIGTIREAVSQMKNKKFDQRAMAEAVGNGSFGVPVVLAGMALAQVGEITGDYPDEDKERKLWEAEGKQPYSVRIGDRWYSLNYMQPFGTILNVGRQVTDDINNGKSEAEAWMAATAAAVQSVSDQSFLKGLNGVMNAINDPERSAASFVRSTAGSIVPNFIRSFATATDGNKRVVDSPFDAVVNSVPGARQTLPKKQDMFGEDQVANDTPINQYLNPLRPSRVKGQDDRLVEELRRLQDSGNGIVTTTFSKDSIGGVELTDEQVRDLNQAVNTIVRVEWDEAIKDPRYAKLTDEDKNTVLKRIKDNVAKSNKASFVKDHKIPTTTEYKASSSDPFNTTGSSVQISDTISPESKSVLSDYYSMESEDREEWFAEANDNEYKYYKAKYENDKANGEISKIEDVARKRYLAKDKIGADYSKDTRDVYKLSKGDIGTYLSQVDQKTGEKLINELIAYDRKLYDAGLVKYRKFKNGIGSTSSGSSGGTRGNGITIGKQLVALEKQLNALKSPTSSSSSSRPATTPQMRKAALARYSSKTAEDKYGKKKISSRSVRA